MRLNRRVPVGTHGGVRGRLSIHESLLLDLEYVHDPNDESEHTTCLKLFLELVPVCRARRRAGRVFYISFQRKRRGGPLQYETEPEKRTGRTVRNREGLSGRRAVGHRRRGHGDTYGYPDCLLTGPRTDRHRRKSYRAGPRLPPYRGETGARRNIPAGFCDRGGLRI